MEFTKDIEFNNMPSPNKALNLTYHGFLSNSSELWIVYGFGENWTNTTETKMEKQENGFSAEIKMLDFDTFNFCFKNANNEWDNNSNCNFISAIVPAKIEPITESPKFDINELIDEILEPIYFKKVEEVAHNTPVEIENKPIDLGAEVAKALSQIDYAEPNNLAEFSSLDEILSGTIIDQEPVELFEENLNDSDEILNSIVSEFFENEVPNPETTIENIKNEEKPTPKIETSLVNIKDPFIVSSRKLSKFYLWKKQIKLALYKALIKLPSLILGTQEDQ